MSHWETVRRKVGNRRCGSGCGLCSWTVLALARSLISCASLILSVEWEYNTTVAISGAVMRRNEVIMYPVQPVQWIQLVLLHRYQPLERFPSMQVLIQHSTLWTILCTHNFVSILFIFPHRWILDIFKKWYLLLFSNITFKGWVLFHGPWVLWFIPLMPLLNF